MSFQWKHFQPRLSRKGQIKLRRHAVANADRPSLRRLASLTWCAYRRT